MAALALAVGPRRAEALAAELQKAGTPHGCAGLRDYCAEGVRNAGTPRKPSVLRSTVAPGVDTVGADRAGSYVVGAEIAVVVVDDGEQTVVRVHVVRAVVQGVAHVRRFAARNLTSLNFLSLQTAV